jgi:hypothetical protein
MLLLLQRAVVKRKQLEEMKLLVVLVLVRQGSLQPRGRKGLIVLIRAPLSKLSMLSQLSMKMALSLPLTTVYENDDVFDTVAPDI